MSEIFPQLGDCIDDLCVIRSMYTERAESRAVAVHDEYRRHSAGAAVDGFVAHLRPGHGEPEPARLRRPVPGTPVVGPPLWNSTFLPGAYQGTYINNNEKDPQKLIQHIRNTALTPEQQRSNWTCSQSSTGAPERGRARPATGSLHPFHGDRVPDADRSPGGIRHHEGDASRRATRTATAISRAAA